MQSAYVELVVKLQDLSTSFRIFETRQHFFLYISQDIPNPKYFNSVIKKFISKKKLLPRKESVVFCRLKSQEYLKYAIHTTVNILQGKNIQK